MDSLDLIWNVRWLLKRVSEILLRVLESGIDDVGFQKSFSGKEEFVVFGNYYKARFVNSEGELKQVTD